MNRIVTSILVAACIACGVTGVAGATTATKGGQPIPKIYTTDDGAQSSGPSNGDPSRIITPEGLAPVVTITGPASGSSFPVDTPVDFAGTFTDEAGDTHVAQWTFNSITAAGAVAEPSGTVSGAWTFTAPGIYYVTLTVTDHAGHSVAATTVNGLDAMIVVFDRGYGFVDGRGKLDSPAGAFAANPQLTGRMDFDFDARYRKDDLVPTGSTSFKFSAGNLDFQSTAYDWFDVNGVRGLYRGTGTINGAGSYAFLVSAVDGDDIGGGAVDRLRIRITNQATGAVVYDNQMGAADTAIATGPITGGDVNVRLPNGGVGHLATVQPSLEPAAPGLSSAFELAQNWPNPFRASTDVRFSLPQRTHLKLAVFDVAGREIATLASGAWDAGTHSVRWSGRTDAGDTARRGVYFVRMAAGLASGEQRFTSVRKMIVLD
jgi:PKD repeat protein